MMALRRVLPSYQPSNTLAMDSFIALSAMGLAAFVGFIVYRNLPTS